MLDRQQNQFAAFGIELQEHFARLCFLVRRAILEKIQGVKLWRGALSEPQTHTKPLIPLAH